MRRLALGLALLGSLVPAISHALGLGDISVDSALNQPLDAEIELVSATAADLQDIRVSLASAEVFQRVGIDRPYNLSELKFEPVLNEEGTPVIRVTSPQPVREPFLNFLIEIRWSKGRLLREYTVLLDPPVFMEQQRAVATAAPVVEPAPEVAAPVPAPMPVVEAAAAPLPEVAPVPEAVEEPIPEPMPQPVAEVQPEPVYEPAPAPVVRAEPAAEPVPQPLILPAPQEQYQYGAEPAPMVEAEPFELFPRIPLDGVYARGPVENEVLTEKGDTLWEIAERTRPDSSVSVPQMMMALLRANPDAFYNDNINNLKSGYILRVPSQSEIDALDRGQAIAEVGEQNALWREYKSQLAGEAVPQSIASAPATAETPLFAEPEPVVEPEPEGRLEILGTEEETGAEGGQVVASGEDTAQLEREIAILREQLESRRVESEELQSRVSELEETLARKDRLIELRSDELRELQQRLDEAPVAPVVEAEPEVIPEPEAVIEPEPVVEAEPLVEPEVAEEAAVEPVAEAEAEAPVVTEPMTEQVPAEEPSPAAELETPPPAVPEPKLTPPAPQAPPSFIDDLLANPNMLMYAGAGVGVLVLLLLLLALRGKGKKGEKAAPVKKEKKSKKGKAEAVTAAAAAAPVAAEAMAEEPEPVIEPEPELQPEPEIKAAAPEPMDFDATMAITGEPEIAAAGGEIEGDDTTEEADVYIAYGLYQQAEDLLRNAISENPGKPVYRLKLAETHFAAKNTAAFEQSARELHDALGDEGHPMWQRAAAMGKELNSSNPLFTGTDTGGFSASDFSHAKPATADIDLGGDIEEPAGETFDLGGEELDLGDFDLGGEPEQDQGLGFAGADSTVEIAAPSFAQPEEETKETELLDLGDFGAELEMGATSDTEATGETPALEETGELEFDLSEFNLGGEAEEPTSSTEDTDDALEVGLDFDTAEFDLGGAAEAEEPAGVAGVDETLELNMADFDFGGAADEESTAASEAPDLDFGADFGMAEEESEAISGGDEVSTKLDLAKAYIDMGDDEGARSTLEEVLSEGSAAQKKEAEELLKQIA